MTIRLAALALASSLAAGAAFAQAPEWPDRPGAPDRAVSGRQLDRHRLAHPREQARRQAGPAGDRRQPGRARAATSASDAVAKAAPDGYTIGVATTSTHALAPSLNRNLPYDPIKDFAPISMVGSAPYVLVVYPGLAAKNVAELIALAKAKPGALNYGSAGPAASPISRASCSPTWPASRSRTCPTRVRRSR